MPDDFGSGPPTGRPSLDELTREECLELLASQPIGRIAVITADGLPMVVPVNHVLDGQTIVFRTAIGTKLDALRRHPVAFQVDHFDHQRRTGWSVVVQGIAHEVTPQEVKGISVESWTTAEHPQWIRVVPRIVSGRRLRQPATP